MRFRIIAATGDMDICFKIATNPFMDETSMAKAYTGHTAFEVVSDSLQMFGAYGYSQDMPLERMLRDVRMFQIGGGTSEAQMKMIARSVFKRKFELRK
jgi:alkylation response protein AidB-like acyl-CoA dehydrogenase